MIKFMRINKGITLIALVITIIVLLILAGISIASLTGENGILNKADTAKVKTEQASAEEQVKLAVMASYNQSGKLDIDELKRELEKIQGNVSIADTNGGFPVTVTIDNKYTFIIDEYGNIEVGGPRPVVDKGSIIVSLADGGEIPNDGANEGTPLKITFTTTMEDGVISGVTPGTIQDNQVTYTTTGTEIEVTFKITGKVENNTYETSYTISLKEYYKKIELEAEDIVKNPSSFYGAEVTGYMCPNSEAVNAWKIFYADENNIYIIADDYIGSTYLPKGKGGSSLNKSSTDYQLYFTDILSDYNASTDITDVKIQALNSSYFNYLVTNNTTNDNNSMKAVAYMLDTNVWNVYKGEKAEYAIGGATIEMFMKSYSQKHNVDFKTRVNSIIGYEISIDGGVSWGAYYGHILDGNDSLYVFNNSEKASNMWIASPSYNNNRIMDVGYIQRYGGYIGSDDYNFGDAGFRPVVCLNSNVQLEKKVDGTYAIK